MGKSPLIVLYTTVAGLEASFSIGSFINYATERAAVLQEYLSRAPELTDKVIEAANKAANHAGPGSLLIGIGLATLTGLMAGLALYEHAKD